MDDMFVEKYLRSNVEF